VLNPRWNLISRTIAPVIHQGNVTGPGESQNGLGDIVQSFFLSPNKTEPFIWGAGPAVLIPTATNGALGTKQLGLGPTVVVLKQKKGWTSGALWNHIWRVAGGSGRRRVNSDFIQPFLTYSTRDGWTYAFNTESTYDWTRRQWSVPINASVAMGHHARWRTARLWTKIRRNATLSKEVIWSDWWELLEKPT
jgi:hypothetical protein